MHVNQPAPVADDSVSVCGCGLGCGSAGGTSGAAGPRAHCATGRDLPPHAEDAHLAAHSLQPDSRPGLPGCQGEDTRSLADTGRSTQ